MSYEMEIVTSNLTCSRVTAETLELDNHKTYMEWKLLGTEIQPQQDTFQDMQAFMRDLLTLAKLDVVGRVELQGQCGDQTELQLNGNTIEERFGRVIYEDDPEVTYNLEGKEIKQTVVKRPNRLFSFFLNLTKQKLIRR